MVCPSERDSSSFLPTQTQGHFGGGWHQHGGKGAESTAVPPAADVCWNSGNGEF